MKSKTSFFSPAVFRKNLTRFAPNWVLYSILMLMILLSFMSTESGVRFAAALADMTHVTAVVGLIYAFINAQLLFGDLYSSRMCNALHAMPLRRECWFCTHVVTGLAFCAVPNAAFTLIFLLLSGNVWQSALLWFAVSLLQYVFFFGIAVLSAYCVGNRFALFLVYGILQFLSPILYWLVCTLYEPRLYGITVDDTVFSLLCPFVQFLEHDYYRVNYDVSGIHATFLGLQFGSGWLYLGICAVLGLGALALAMVLYRHRNLECAGDFVALRPLGPVFHILYTFCAGVCCHGFFSLFWGDDNFFFLALGLGIGFFTGLMLLQRSVRVIRGKSIALFLGLLAGFGLTLALTVLDPLGVTRWIPEASDVRHVQIHTGTSRYLYTAEENAAASDASDIAKILAIHQQCLRQQEESSQSGTTIHVSLTYTLQNGLTRQRSYHMSVETEAGSFLKEMLSRPEVVLRELYTDPQTCEPVRMELSTGLLVLDEKAKLESLVQAIVKDCEAGVLAQDWAYRKQKDATSWLFLEARLSNGNYTTWDICFSSQCTNILAWLEENYDLSWQDILQLDGKFAY